MNWKFWQKANHSKNAFIAKEIKFAKPREIPQRVGIYLVSQLKLDPDWVWNLKCVLRPKADEKNDFDIRVYNPAAAAGKGVTVLNYDSLDLHPEIILFFGSFNRKSGRILIEQTLEKVA